jgi:hypothetical protein
MGMGALLMKIAHNAPHHISPSKTGEPTDLNDADREQFKKLHLDDLAIDRSMENRPYWDKLELVSRMIIPKALYSRIRHRICVQPLAQR